MTPKYGYYNAAIAYASLLTGLDAVKILGESATIEQTVHHPAIARCIATILLEQHTDRQADRHPVRIRTRAGSKSAIARVAQARQESTFQHPRRTHAGTYRHKRRTLWGPSAYAPLAN